MSLPGERIGYACVTDEAEDSHELLLAISGASRSMGHVCAPSTMQQMLARCVKLRPDVEAYDRNRRTLYDALAEYGYKCVKPKGAFYLFFYVFRYGFYLFYFHNFTSMSFPKIE